MSHQRLLGVLVSEDRRLERLDFKHGITRANPHRIAHYLEALEKAEANPEGLEAGIRLEFCGGIVAKLLRRAS